MNCKYDVAISFAGEDRDTARAIAVALRDREYAVFFDEFERARLFGEDLSVELHDIYSEEARYCVILISSHYASKAWTSHERRAAIGRALDERRGYILPVRLDGSDLPGFPKVIGYIDLRSVPIAELVRLICEKLGLPSASASSSPSEAAPTRDKIREVLAACYRRAIFARMHAQIDPFAMMESLSECRATLQKMIVYVEPEPLQRIVAEIIAEIDFIERLSTEISDWKQLYRELNAAKLRIVTSLNILATEAGVSFVLPPSLTEEDFMAKEGADKPPEDQRQYGAENRFLLAEGDRLWDY